MLTLYHRHLDDVEKRLRKLERLFSHHLPGINLEEALRAPILLQVNQVPDPHPQVTAAVLPEIEAREDQPENEALPPEASGFDWIETAADPNELADGMASLSLNPSGKGYLGTQQALNLFIFCCSLSIGRVDIWRSHLEISPAMEPDL